MANERAPWMLTVGQLREHLRDVPDETAVALVTPPSAPNRPSTIHSVDVSYTGGPVLRLSPASPRPTGELTDAESPGRAPQPTDQFVDRFGFAVARAASFELKARLLADKTPALQKSCLSAELTPLVSKVIEAYSEALSPDDTHLLKALPGIRNKLLHLELSRATGRLGPLTDSLAEAGVIMVDLSTGDSRVVAQTGTATGRIFGWLLEASASGAFTIAADKFLGGVIILERLMTECDRRMDTRER